MGDNILLIHKAQAIGTETVRTTVIQISESLPSYETLEMVDSHYNAQAWAIEAALIESLPGGTYDRLLGRMLERKASHFRVAYGGIE